MKGFLSTQVVGAHTAMAWVALEGAANSATVNQLMADHFVTGLRENLTGPGATGTSLAVQFGTPAGALDLLRRQRAALQATRNGGLPPQRFAVPGIPGASGFVFSAPPARTQVIFSHGNFEVEIALRGNAAAGRLSAAALSVYRRLAA